MFESYRNYERIGLGTANQFQQNQIFARLWCFNQLLDLLPVESLLLELCKQKASEYAFTLQAVEYIAGVAQTHAEVIFLTLKKA